MGPTYEIQESEQRHAGQPPPHGVPVPYDCPSLIDLLPAAPRALPVSQDIEHGSEESRDAAFWLGIQQAADMGEMHRTFGLGRIGVRPWIWRDRRISGRRYRETNNVEDLLGPQEPYDIRDVPWERFVRGW